MTQKPEGAFAEDLAVAPAGMPAPRRGWRARIGDTLSTGRRWRRLVLVGAVVLAVLLVVYFLIGALLVHQIDDDIGFAPAAPVTGGSRAIDMAAALIEREVDQNGWTANDPFFLPGSLLDNMPNFQQGVIYAISRFVTEMGDQIGRTRGTSQLDPDLDRATGLLRYPGTVWLFDFSTSWAPTASAESQYRAAAAALRNYNERVAGGTAPFERRADNLILTIERIVSDLGSQSAAIAEHVEGSGSRLIDTQADDIFYATKGRLYGYFMILRALGEDFEPVIARSGAANVWTQMLDSLREAASLQPLIVTSGAPDAQFLPSHLSAQGFFLLRARTQLREITAVMRD